MGLICDPTLNTALARAIFWSEYRLFVTKFIKWLLSVPLISDHIMFHFNGNNFELQFS